MKSDKLRGSPQPPTHTIDTGKKFVQPAGRAEPPHLGPVPYEGKTPDMNHSENLPMTDNTRSPRKDPIPFGS